MVAIKIYKNWTMEGCDTTASHGFYFALEPLTSAQHDGFIEYQGDTDSVNDYILPDGYTIGHDDTGKQHVYDSNDDFCKLTTYNNSPAIITNNSSFPLILKKVKELAL